MSVYDDELKELDEAIEASDNALEHLEKARQMLDGASGWGIVDMVGGGFFSTYLKRSRLHDAQREVQLAQNALRIFNRELRDVAMFDTVDIGQDSFLGMADYFFDGVLADFLSYDRIQRSRDDVERCIAEVERIRDRLIDREEELVSMQ
jgi:hypothetical protein